MAAAGGISTPLTPLTLTLMLSMMIKERLGALLIKAFAAGFKRFPETVKVSPKTVRSKADTVGFKSYTKLSLIHISEPTRPY